MGLHSGNGRVNLQGDSPLRFEVGMLEGAVGRHRRETKAVPTHNRIPYKPAAHKPHGKILSSLALQTSTVYLKTFAVVILSGQGPFSSFFSHSKGNESYLAPNPLSLATKYTTKKLPAKRLLKQANNHCKPIQADPPPPRRLDVAYKALAV